jgi:hypothetical protein
VGIVKEKEKLITPKINVNLVEDKKFKKLKKL